MKSVLGSRNTICLTLLVALSATAGGVAWFQSDEVAAPPTNGWRPPPDQGSPGSNHSEDDAHEDEVPALPRAVLDEDSAVDLSQTSWQDPFAAEYWASEGWTFDGESMHCAGSPGEAAIFRRPYRKLMLAARVEPVAEPGPFEVRLTAGATGSVLTVMVGDDAIVVSAESPQRKRRIVRRRELGLAMSRGQPGELRLSATGNRVQIVWNGRRVFTCDQPADQSGHEVHVGLVSTGTAFRVSRLRIEGE